jgi:hypothetical protein
MRRELRRRSAFEAMIGHMKLDGKLGRNHLAGVSSDWFFAETGDRPLSWAGHCRRLMVGHWGPGTWAPDCPCLGSPATTAPMMRNAPHAADLCACVAGVWRRRW